jgi:hypothetical protein
MDSHQKSIMASYHYFLLFFAVPINIRDMHSFSSFLLPLVLCKLYVIALAFVAFSHIALGFVAFTLTSALHT